MTVAQADLKYKPRVISLIAVTNPSVDLSGRTLNDLLPKSRRQVVLRDNNGILAVVADYWANTLRVQNPHWEELSRQEGIRATKLLDELERTKNFYQKHRGVFEEGLVTQAITEVRQGSTYITGEDYKPILEGKRIDFNGFQISYEQTPVRF